jgi:hypothetical protein
MRYTPVLLALPALSLAQDQVPLFDKLKGWFNKAQSFVPASIPSIPSIIPDVVDSGASKVAQSVVYPLNLSNWKDVLSPSATAAQKDGPEEVMVFLTGGNKTCHGLCANATAAWNVSSLSPSLPRSCDENDDMEANEPRNPSRSSQPFHHPQSLPWSTATPKKSFATSGSQVPLQSTTCSSPSPSPTSPSQQQLFASSHSTGPPSPPQTSPRFTPSKSSWKLLLIKDTSIPLMVLWPSLD